MSQSYDLVVIGAGHAGCEAALAAARLGLETLLLTLNLDAIALMPCNPSIGGTGKSQLVREVDALGGEMALVIDEATLQTRTLNTGKGPAVHSLRAQADKRAYQARMIRALFSQQCLTIRQGEVVDILTENARVTGIKTLTGDVITCRAVVVAAGVYLRSRIIIGEARWDGGPQGLMSSKFFSSALESLGFRLRRFKTGTPARLDGRSIDFSRMTPQPGDEPPCAFSFMARKAPSNLAACYLTWTNPQTHAIIRENLHRSPLFSGDIKGTGARYCPSIEDKIHRFAGKDRHQVFLEPEGRDSPEWYAQGLSSSLPEDVQIRLYRSVEGLEQAKLTRLAYAIEYDCIDPTELSPALASNRIKGLLFAGQINGTSGYEEAAAQGLIAGINASRYLKCQEPVIITRSQGYIGVLTDDLSSKGTDEPYRMMTGRAEFRLSLRQDNADLRLTALGHEIGLADDKRLHRMEKKARDSQALLDAAREAQLIPTLKRGDTSLRDAGLAAGMDGDAVRQAEIQILYDGYLQKELAQVKQAQAMESHKLPDDMPYEDIKAIRIEARQKLSRHQPVSLGQAARIPGVSPADVAVLSVWLKRHNAKLSGDL
ncbi:MAG: tRNA uridine-5-carboxymethylaminomethyl(34) synthesis enzyme MnmG [Eubacteriales bacterium]|nr:tRNA uridine-5-carboxymethylaminomethyl(34) synthesis enzyme MnmG [Eubacteriales bacterium]